mmetsp:Transcript_19603/g.27364  ORF Transcript_19603/g.27364 Transcript_19603/m.27364 type:complete len:277 (-) Transcript_19603:391-1221(-)|eukprot:CAMPEP_0184478740 /NCGR_PEP_ID=MMETSP0113_2-20130426/679_1 /TAXON_ID=91329 /ORGANISM="Norrisiella sphaerica, Strain BC52" /LENGTH=276 /DNA_ID=CAMNT_0026856633 /DNA_START=127 /DNA_END=957 /DNA_ORIENTATION=+
MTDSTALLTRLEETKGDERLEKESHVDLEGKRAVAASSLKTEVFGSRLLLPTLLILSNLSAAAVVVLMYIWMSKYNGGKEAMQGFSWEDKSPKVFNWHPVFMTAGFGFCTTQALLAWAMPFPRVLNKSMHAIWHTGAWAFSAVGLYAVFKFHNDMGIANLYSAHSWFGLATIGLYGLQYILGLTFIMPLSIVGAEARELVLVFHKFFGLGAFLMALATMAMGILEKMTFNKTGPSKGMEYEITNAAGMVLICQAIVVSAAMMIRAGQQELGQRKQK